MIVVNIIICLIIIKLVKRVILMIMDRNITKADAIVNNIVGRPAIIRNFVATVVLLVIFILMHFLVIDISDSAKQTLLSEWQMVFKFALFFESLFIDLFLMPLWHMALAQRSAKYLKVLYPQIEQ